MENGTIKYFRNYERLFLYGALGFNIRQFPVGKTHSGMNPGNKQPLGFKTIITPSKEAVLRHLQQTREALKELKTAPQEAVIRRLSGIIRGWSNYFSKVVSKATFSKANGRVFNQLRAWARYRHPTKNIKWVMRKYWRIEEGKGWSFATPNHSYQLHKHQETPITRHVKVQGTRSPYDGDWTYWGQRTKDYPSISNRVARLLKRQGGICLECELYFKHEDVPEVDHIVPKERGGKDVYYNLQLLHRHCHDVKTAEDRQRYGGQPLTY